MKTQRFLLFSGCKVDYFPKVGSYLKNGYELQNIEQETFSRPIAAEVLKIIDGLKLLDAPLLFSVDVVAIEKMLIEKKFFDWYDQMYCQNLTFYDEEGEKKEPKELFAYVHQKSDMIGVSFKNPELFRAEGEEGIKAGPRYLIKEFLKTQIPLMKNSSMQLVFSQD